MDESVNVVRKLFLIRVIETLATSRISKITFMAGTGTTNAKLFITRRHTCAQVIFIDPFEDETRTRLRVDVVDDPHRRARDIIKGREKFGVHGISL